MGEGVTCPGRFAVTDPGAFTVTGRRNKCVTTGRESRDKPSGGPEGDYRSQQIPGRSLPAGGAAGEARSQGGGSRGGDDRRHRNRNALERTNAPQRPDAGVAQELCSTENQG